VCKFIVGESYLCVKAGSVTIKWFKMVECELNYFFITGFYQMKVTEMN